MSKQWTRAENDDEWVCVTWWAGQSHGGRAVDFGVRHERAFEVVEAARARGDVAFACSDAGDVVNGNEFVAMVMSMAAWTHGEFGGTMSVAASVEFHVG